MSNPSTFGSRVKQLRQEHGLTQDALAERVGCATQTIRLVLIRAPALLVPTIADAVGIGEEGGRPRLERLKEGLRAMRLLLVLDNFEQIIPAAGLLADLLWSCPHLKALVTSREVLRVRGEHVFTVHPLSVLVSKRATASELLSQSAAVQLFVERAAAAKPDFAITDENAPAVAELCQRLDGLPLAIELAAARSTLFPPEALLARLSSRLQLLTGGPRDLPARQQTLRNTIAWSYDLLTDSEQKLFRRLCIFTGGRTLDAIAAVCTAAGELDSEIVDGLGSLLDKSLLWQDAGASREPRFLMLETIWEYGLEQLEHSGEAEVTRRAHADYYLQLVDQSERHLWGGAQAQTLDRLEQEHDNLRAALTWHLAHEEGVEPALWMAGLLWRFWEMRGHWTEGQQWLERALSRRADAAPARRWIALHGAGNLSLDLGEYARAKAYYEESLAVTQQLHVQHGIANSLLNLSSVIFNQGDVEHAITLQEQALAIHREIGNKIGIALTLHNLASMLVEEGDYDRAAICAEESLACYRDLGDSRGIAMVLHDLALLAHRHGAYERARTLFEECRTIYEHLGARNDLARALNDLGKLVDDQEEYEAARVLYAESLTLAAELGDRRCQAAVLHNLGRLAHRMGDQERALMLCNKSLSLQRDLGDKRGIAMVLESLRQVAPQSPL
jgi:predicted ATPase